MAVKVAVECHCLRCGHTWLRRSDCLLEWPAACANPKCKSRVWQTPRREYRSVLKRTKPVRERRIKGAPQCPVCYRWVDRGTLTEHRKGCKEKNGTR